MDFITENVVISVIGVLSTVVGIIIAKTKNKTIKIIIGFLKNNIDGIVGIGSFIAAKTKNKTDDNVIKYVEKYIKDKREKEEKERKKAEKEKSENEVEPTETEVK